MDGQGRGSAYKDMVLLNVPVSTEAAGACRCFTRVSCCVLKAREGQERLEVDDQLYGRPCTRRWSRVVKYESSQIVGNAQFGADLNMSTLQFR